MSTGKAVPEAPSIKGVRGTFYDEKAPKELKVGNRVLHYVATVPHQNDVRLVSDYYEAENPRIVEARVLNPDTGVFERRAVGAKAYHKKARAR